MQLLRTRKSLIVSSQVIVVSFLGYTQGQLYKYTNPMYKHDEQQ